METFYFQMEITATGKDNKSKMPIFKQYWYLCNSILFKKFEILFHFISNRNHGNASLSTPHDLDNSFLKTPIQEELTAISRITSNESCSHNSNTDSSKANSSNNLLKDETSKVNSEEAKVDIT